MSRLRTGTSNPPSRETSTPSIPSLPCITTGKDYRRTIPKGHAGAEKPPNKAMLRLSTLSASSIAVDKECHRDHAEAVRWHRKSADQGYPQAQYALGFMYYYGYRCVAGSSSGRRLVSASCR